jgi:hypothetical protein
MGAAALALNFATTQTGLVKQQKMELTKPKPCVELSTKEKSLRDEKWLFCKLVEEEHQRTRHNYTACCETIAAAKAHLFPQLVSAGKNGRSALNWTNCRKWREKLGRVGKKINWDNKDALANKWSGGNSERYGDERFWILFLATYLNRNHWSLKESWRMAAKRTRELDSLAKIPKLHQVKYQVDKLNPLAVANARLGPAWVRDNMLSYISRDWSAVMPNEVWFADHRVFDFPIRVWDEKEQCWMAQRPWICIYFDAKSWHVISAQIQEKSPNSWTVRNGLALGVAAYGRPDAIYVDNGKDFLVKGFGAPVTFSMNESGTEIYEHSILKELGIDMTNSLPYNGRAKCVERFFGYVSRAFDKLFPGYLSNTPSTRPDQAELYYKCENAHLLPNLNELCDLFDKWLVEYNNTPNNGKILQGQTPAQAFAVEKRLQRAPMTEQDLFEAFLKPVNKLHKVQRGPSVFFGKQEYRGTDKLWNFFEKKVMIKTDANDPSHVFAFQPNGKMICECKTKPLVSAMAKTEAQIKKQKSELALQRRQAKLAKTMVLQLTGGFEKLDPLTLYSLPAEQLDAPARLKLISSKKSVKGGDHNPAIYAPHGDHRLQSEYKEAIAIAAAPKQDNEPRLTEEERSKLLEFQSAVISGPEPVVPENNAGDDVDINDFHKYMTAKKIKGDDNYGY